MKIQSAQNLTSKTEKNVIDIDKKIEQLKMQLAQLEKEKVLEQLKERYVLEKQDIVQTQDLIKKQVANLAKHNHQIEQSYKELQRLEGQKQQLEKNLKKPSDDLEQQYKQIRKLEEQIKKMEMDLSPELAKVESKTDVHQRTA